MKTALYTTLALLAFAGNSVLCRLALKQQSIDAAGFTLVRLLSGIVVLLLLVGVRQRSGIRPCLQDSCLQASWLKGGWLKGWLQSALLFIYALGFSYAYISLDTGMGALILFASVQLTMILSSLLAGNRLLFLEWLGVAIAFSGFLVLVLPGASAPSAVGFFLMVIAGIAWALYSIFGRASRNPLADTCANFLRTLPWLCLLALVAIPYFNFTARGVWLAVLSGALASGIGYALWYAALKNLSAVQAAVLQLLVPAIAALGGLIFTGEWLSLRLIVASLFILSGIFFVIKAKPRAK